MVNKRDAFRFKINNDIPILRHKQIGETGLSFQGGFFSPDHLQAHTVNHLI
jgi:hypothetical protein